MFNTLLIANRGEIACQIIATARRLGIRTVAIYSDADRDAPHTRLADTAVRIGPPPAAASYLDIDAILEACHTSGAEAVHPGYGFLAENAEFAARVQEAGLVFIGPPPQAIARLGDKLEAKRLARQAGVSTIPGPLRIIQNADDAVTVARELGYPIMLKANAGGGGRGLRRVDDDTQCREGFQRAASESQSSFGSAGVLIETYIAQPRHIEIQILADKHGRIVHLGERECSVQRRHQKVIEEAPSPLLDAAARAALAEQAVALARAAGYESAGTVEFVVDAEGNFYFLEMNTRLQVEYAVTEQITGVRLVEWMIRIAAGEPLEFGQDDVRWNGWAVESRVYAEDPSRRFLPSVGRLVRYVPPLALDGVRVDSGVEEGCEVTIHYDPLLAKVIAHGATRDEALERMQSAIEGFTIHGVAHNLEFLAALIDRPRFRAARLSTDLIADEFPEGFDPAATPHPDPAVLVAVAASIHRREAERAARITGQLPGYASVPDRWVVLMQGQPYPVTVQSTPDGDQVQIGDRWVRIESDWRCGQPRFEAQVDGQPVCVQVEPRGVAYRLSHRGFQATLQVLSPRAAELLSAIPPKTPKVQERFLCSPMPGLLSQLLVEVGHEVKVGQPLAVVEAMKMENILCAHRDGRIIGMIARVGETLAVEQPILEFE